MRVFTLVAEVERRRRQALGEGFGLRQQRRLAAERPQERRAAVAVVAGLGDGSAVEHDGGAEAHRFLAGEIRHLEGLRSKEHTSELQSLMRISYTVFSLKQTHNALTDT